MSENSTKHMEWYKQSKTDLFFSNGATVPSGPGPPHYQGFTITLKHTTLGRTPLDKWSARRRDLVYLTTHNTHKRQTSMQPAGFEPTIPASERPQIHTLNRAATGIGQNRITRRKTCPSATFSITDSTRTGLRSYSCFCDKRPATNRLFHGTSYSVHGQC
jgi:hypothetical protein